MSNQQGLGICVQKKERRRQELRDQSKLFTNLNQVGLVRILEDKDEFLSTTSAPENF